MFEYHRGLVVKKSPQSWEVNRGVNPVVMLDVHGRLLNGVQGEVRVCEGKLGSGDIDDVGEELLGHNFLGRYIKHFGGQFPHNFLEAGGWGGARV